VPLLVSLDALRPRRQVPTLPAVLRCPAEGRHAVGHRGRGVVDSALQDGEHDGALAHEGGVAARPRVEGLHRVKLAIARGGVHPQKC